MDKRWRPATFARLALALVLALSLSGLLTYGVSGAYGAEPGKASNKIISFERINPAYTECVSYGTEREKLSLPKALRAVCELPEPVKLNKEAEDSDEPQNRFQQTAPAADDQGDFDYYWYGYVAPRNELELRAADQLVIYTIYYADGNQAWRVHGTYDGLNEGFYACDEQGNLTGIVVDVPVTWKGNYQPTQEGIYSFAAKAEGFKYNGVAPAAEVTVCEEGIDPYGQTECDHDEGECDGDHEGEAHAHEGEAYREDAPAREDAPIKPLALEALAAECTCDVANGETNDEAQTTHAENCPLYTPECTCDDVENGHSSECPCFEALADCECGIPATSNPWQHNEGCPLWGEPECTCEGDEHDPLNEECPLYDPTLFAFFDEDVPAGPLTEEVADEDEDIAPLGIGPNGGGTNDVAQDDWMLARAPTSGNEQYYNTQYNNDVRLPGIWIDYVNTIWLNKGVNKFDWTPAAETNALNNWVWGGGISNTTGNPQTTALAYAARNGNTLTVYSGEQLRWALTNVGTAAAGTQTGGTAAQGTATNRIELGANINLNGNVRNWTTIYRTDGATITLTSTAGNHFTIYNMGIFQDTFGNSVGLYCSGQNSGGVAGNPGTLNAVRNFERFSMETCKVVAGQTMTMYGTDRIPTDIAGTSVLGQHVSQRG
ncbi:MAG: hypothetical protein FWG00_03530, partial [Coriobacteriia bacterium]|nr:hypothetical protein [Coriobacteriia bacterium]